MVEIASDDEGLELLGVFRSIKERIDRDFVLQMVKDFATEQANLEVSHKDFTVILNQLLFPPKP